MVILSCAGSPLAHRWLTDSISVGFLKLRARKVFKFGVLFASYR
jgi:hypothetical protein